MNFSTDFADVRATKANVNGNALVLVFIFGNDETDSSLSRGRDKSSAPGIPHPTDLWRIGCVRVSSESQCDFVPLLSLGTAELSAGGTAVRLSCLRYYLLRLLYAD